MPDPLPSCFRVAAAGGGPPSSTETGPTVTTSVYETSLGLAALSWSRTVLGLLLRAELRLSLDDGDEDLDPDRPITIKLRPWLLFSRRGSKRFRHRNHSIDLAWDLTRAKFHAAGGPEPASGYFLSIAVDSELILIAGNLVDLAFKKAKQKKQDLDTTLISRREHVTMKENRCYKTQAKFGAKERSISIDLSGEMSLEVDGKQILQIRRLRWKFRGSEMIHLDGGDRILLSWDLHNWLFPPKDPIPSAAGDAAAAGNAVFVFRFESDEMERMHFGKEEGLCKETLGGYLGKTKTCSQSSSFKKKKSLLKTNSSSSSSSSSVSSAGSWTVMEWASAEENELRSREGFSLLVHAWKG